MAGDLFELYGRRIYSRSHAIAAYACWIHQAYFLAYLPYARLRSLILPTIVE